jgi:hypothetical protein
LNDWALFVKKQTPCPPFIHLDLTCVIKPKKTKKKEKNRLNGKYVFDFNPMGFSLIPIVFL